MRKKPILLGFVAAVAIIQLIPVSRSNPPVEQEVTAPDSVRAVLRESCYDCHSHETKWPWYAHVAPASWLVANDVNHGRTHANFSAWNHYDAAELAKLLDEIGDVLDEGEMPLWYYLPMHPSARLTDQDRQTLRAWAQGDAAPPAEH